MTLYLKVGVGAANYLLAAAQVTDVGLADNSDNGGLAIDCRRLFGDPIATPGYRVVLATEDNGSTGLVVDRLEGLVELGDEAFRALPPIGRFGELIDAVSVPGSAEPPALRLCAGFARLAGALSAQRD